MAVSFHPVHLYRCLVCGQEGLNITEDRIYCPQCGQVYPLMHERIADFLSPLPAAPALSPAQSLAHTPLFTWGYERLWRPWSLSLLTGDSFPPEQEASLLRELVGEPSTVLDLGAAHGYWSRMLLTQRPELTLIGIDNAAGVLRESLHQIQPQWTHYSLIRAQAEQLPLATNSVQAVVIGATLNELPLVPCLQEVARVLQPQGVLVSMHSQRVDEGWGHWAQQSLKLSGLQFFSRDELTAACEGVGLRVQRYLSYGVIAFIQAGVVK